MDEIIEILKGEIAKNNLQYADVYEVPLSEEQHGYVIGLADALKVVERCKAKQLEVGRKYYVLSYENHIVQIKHMKLYRINHTEEKISYCFAVNGKNNLDKIILNDRGTNLRVFKDYESAQNGIQDFMYSITNHKR